MKPKKSARYHQTLSLWVGSENETTTESDSHWDGFGPGIKTYEKEDQLLPFNDMFGCLIGGGSGVVQ